MKTKGNPTKKRFHSDSRVATDGLLSATGTRNPKAKLIMNHVVIVSHCNQTRQAIELFCAEIFSQHPVIPRFFFIDTRPMKYERELLNSIIKAGESHPNHNIVLLYQQRGSKLLKNIPDEIKIDIDSSLFILEIKLLNTATGQSQTNGLLTYAQQAIHINRLTLRETEVYRYMRKGFSVRSISEKLSVNIKTVYSHQYSIVKKLSIPSVKRLYFYAVRE
ncbi:helix-turn-helix domain-containing protein [Serratia proteamaculans]|uniref:helix-turn-helix domain-containing protein n=1 Tax=Serratia proteamaculans TaxID=28151 RepID=UPI0039B0A837